MAHKPKNYSTTHENANLTAPAPHLNGAGAPLEKNFSNSGNSFSSNPYHLGAHHDSDDAPKRIRNVGSISISPELFEKIYLSPQNRVHGDLRKALDNPTPLALIDFLLSLSLLSCDLIGGAGGNGAAGIGKRIIGNTFPFVVFTGFGVFWLSWAATLQPFYNAYGAYSTTPNPADGINTVGFRSSFGLMCFIYLICSLRTNIVFFIIFLTPVIASACLAGAYRNLNLGSVALAGRLQTTAGACTFVTSACGWWIFPAIMPAALDFPPQLPVRDLSHVIRGASDRARDYEKNV